MTMRLCMTESVRIKTSTLILIRTCSTSSSDLYSLTFSTAKPCGYDRAAGSNRIRGQLRRRHAQVPHGPALHAAPRQGPRPCSPTREFNCCGTRTHTRRRQETSEYTFENLNIVVTTIIGERFAGAISNSPLKLLVQ